MNDSIQDRKPVHLALAEYMLKKNISNNAIAKEFKYTREAISNFLLGKTAEDSKLNIIAELWLELQILKEGTFISITNANLSDKEKEKYEKIIQSKNEEIDVLKQLTSKQEGQIMALKESKEELMLIIDRNNFHIASMIEDAVDKVIKKKTNPSGNTYSQQNE